MDPEAIVLSPGPCTPNEAGICLDADRARRARTIPIFGVCLGHQAIGQAYRRHGRPRAGADARQARQIRHTGARRLPRPQRPLPATRYHSLTIEPRKPARRARGHRRAAMTA